MDLSECFSVIFKSSEVLLASGSVNEQGNGAL